jgi:hypothetical protein
LLRFTFEQLGGLACGKVFRGGKNYFKGGSNTDEYQKTVDKVLHRVNGTQRSVDEVSKKTTKKVDKSLLQLRQDNLNTDLTNCEAQRKVIKNCFTVAFSGKTEIRDEAALAKKLDESQGRVAEKLKYVVDHVPTCFDRRT